MAKTITLAKKRATIGEAVVCGTKLRLKGAFWSEFQEFKKLDSEEAKEAYMLGLIPQVLEGMDGEEIDVNVDDIPVVELLELSNRIFDANLKGVFTKASGTRSTDASSEGDE